MATHIFPPSAPASGLQRRLFYPGILSETVRATTDAIEALTLFDQLLKGEAGGPESLGFMTFDAHGGDTGCQLRAGMMEEFFSDIRHTLYDASTNTVETPYWISHTLPKLEALRQKSLQVCEDLTVRRVLPEKFGISNKESTPHVILQALGWDETVPPQQTEDEYLAERLANWNSDDEGRATSSSERSSSLASTNTSTSTPVVRKLDTTQETWSWKWDLETKWDLSDSATMLRFVVYAFTLSKYKLFCRMDGVLGARLNPEAAVTAGAKLTDAHWNHKNTDYRPYNTKRIDKELKCLQTWITDFSCAWQRSLAQRSFMAPSIEGLLANSIQKSYMQLTASASYNSYILMRESLARKRASLVLIDRHFCEKGFHYNCFRATLNEPQTTQTEKAYAAGQSVQWSLEPLSMSDLQQSKDTVWPHVVIFGNSIDGPYDAYLDRVPQKPGDKPEGSMYHNGPCSSNDDHAAQLATVDFDRLALAFFADHDIYAFKLLNGLSHEAYFETCLDNFEKHVGGARKLLGLKEGWQRSKGEADFMGTGKGSLHNFGIQHMFLETEPRLGSTLQTWSDRSDLMILGAGMA